MVFLGLLQRRLVVFAVSGLVFLPTASFSQSHTWPGKEVLPVWISAVSQQVFPATKVNAALVPVEGAELFVTVVFEEREQEAVALSWRGADGNEFKMDSLGETESGFAKRTVKIPVAFLAGPGILSISSLMESPVIHRVRLEWVKPTNTFVAESEEAPGFIEAGGNAVSRESLESAEVLSPPDAWKGNILEASLQEAAMPLDGNTEFVVPLTELPKAAILKVQVKGMPLGEGPVVWLNGYRLGELALAVPGLADVGFIEDRGVFTYAGWRNASIFIPAQVLRTGDNLITLESPFTKVAIKNAALQLMLHEKEIPSLVSEVEAEEILEQPDLTLPEY